MDTNASPQNARIISTPNANDASLDTVNIQPGAIQQTADPQTVALNAILPASGHAPHAGSENANPSPPASDLDCDPLSCLGSAVDNLTGQAVAEDIPQVKKRTRMTKERRNALLLTIGKEHNDGLPIQAIMLRHCLSNTQVEHFQVELFQKGLITQRDSAFEVVRVTDTVKKLLALEEPWAWLKLEKSPDGSSYILSEYTEA